MGVSALRCAAFGLLLLNVSWLLGCSGGKTIRLDWPEPMKISHAMEVPAVCISPSGQKMGIVSEDRAAAVIDATATKPDWVMLDVLPEKVFDIPTSIKFTSDGRMLLVYNRDYLARVDIKKATYSLSETKTRISDPLRDATAISPDGKSRAVGFTHGSLEIYDVDSDERTMALKGHKDTARIVADYMLIVGVWTTPSRGAAKITALTYSVDGTLLASGDSLGGIRVWNAKTGQLHADLVKRNLILMKRVLWLEISPDNRYVAAGTASDVGDKITVIDMDSKEVVLEIPDVSLSGLWLWAPSNPMPADILTDFSPDGHYFFCPKKSDIQVWDLIEKKVVRTLKGHRGNVLSLAVTPDGKWLVSTSKDRTGRIWDLTTGKCVTVWVALPRGQWLYFDIEEGRTNFYQSEKASKYFTRLK